MTLAGNLLRKAKARIAELAKGVTSMELTIVDESDTGADIGDIRARMYVRCISKPHGIDGTYLCLSRTRDYLNPSGNTITIGAAGVRLTSESAKQDQNITSIEDELLGQTSKIEVITGKVDQINAQKMYRTELVVEGVNIFRIRGRKASFAAGCIRGTRRSRIPFRPAALSGTGIPVGRTSMPTGTVPIRA